MLHTHRSSCRNILKQEIEELEAVRIIQGLYGQFLYSSNGTMHICTQVYKGHGLEGKFVLASKFTA